MLRLIARACLALLVVCRVDAEAQTATRCGGKESVGIPARSIGTCKNCKPLPPSKKKGPKPECSGCISDNTRAPIQDHGPLVDYSHNQPAPGGDGGLGPHSGEFKGAVFLGTSAPWSWGRVWVRGDPRRNPCEPASNWCPAPGPLAGGGGGPRDAQSDVQVWALQYFSQDTPSRMTGNWWFPFDIFVVPQPNGDLHYFGPGIPGDVYQWDPVGQVFVSPPGAFDKMVKNGNGTWTRTTKYGEVWQFNGAGNLSSVSTRYGLGVTINRNPQQAITSIVDYAGRSTTIAYDAQGRATSITDWGGRSTTLTYTAQGYLASITWPATTFYDHAAAAVVTRGKTQTFTYVTGTGTANDGNLSTWKDDRGSTTHSLSYDTQDRLTSGTRYGQAWTHTFMPSGSTKVVDPDGVTTVYSFGPAGAIVRKEVFTRTGLGLPPLRPNEPNSYVWQFERNATCGCALVTKIIYPSGSSIAFAYDQWGNMTSRTVHPPTGSSEPPLKETWTYSSFAQFCRALTYVSELGNEAGATAADHTTTWTYDASGSLTQVQYPKATVNGTPTHVQESYTRNSRGQRVTYTAPGGSVVRFEYDPVTFLQTKVIEDPDGLAITGQYAYDVHDRLVTVTDPRGNSTALTWNALDQFTERQIPDNGSTVQYLYDNNDHVYREDVENKDATGAVDAANPWFSTTFIVDQSDRLTSLKREIDASSTATTAYEYSAGGRLTRVTDPNGNKTEYEHDERGLVFKEIRGAGTPEAGVTQYEYDVNGTVSRVTDERGNDTRVFLDYALRHVRTVFPNQSETRRTWDTGGQITAVEQLDVNGVAVARTTIVIDPYGLIVAIERHLLDASGNTTSKSLTSFAFDAALRRKSRTSPTGAVATYTYDALDRLVAAEDAATNRIEFTYDFSGNVTVTKRRDWNHGTAAYDDLVHEVTYDDLNRPTQIKRRDPGSTLASTSSREYDGRSLQTRVIDPMGNTERRTWDGRGGLLTVVRDLRAGGTGAGSVTGTVGTTYAYDATGRLVSIKDGKNQATSYEWDARARLTKETDSAGNATAYAYDAGGNTTTITQPTGTVVSNVFDAMNRLTSQTATLGGSATGDTSVDVAYDALGRIVTITDDDSTVERTFDSLTRLLSESQGPNPMGTNGKTFQFAYNADDRVTRITYPDGTVEDRNRDVRGRLSSIAIQGGPTLATYQYAGLRAPQVTLTNSVVRTQTYDALQRVTHVEYTRNTTSLRKFQYVFDLAGNRLLEKRHHAGGTGDNYTLDSLYRTVLIKAGVADPVLEHQTPGSQTVTTTTAPTYDLAGSRTQVAVTSGGTTTTASYSVDSLNFYTAVGGTTHARDANGNLTDDGVNLYEWDYRNRLVRIRKKSDSSVVATYEYDAIGRRKGKSTSAGSTTVYWVGFQVSMAYDSFGVVFRRHYGDFRGVVSSAQRDIGDVDGDGNTAELVFLTPLYDGAFDCVGIVGPAGTVVEQYVHSYEGARTILDGAGVPRAASAVGWDQGYGGMEYDAESGLWYGVHRYYSPVTGRFLSQDPAGRWHDPSAVGNSFAYVGDSYRNAWDPLSLRKKKGTCCGKKIAVILWEKKMFPGIRNLAVAAVRSQARDVLEKADAWGSKTRTWLQRKIYYNVVSFGIGSKADLKKAKDFFKKNGNNPCIKAVVLLAHGASHNGKWTGKHIWSFGKSFSLSHFFGELTYGLDCVISGACGGRADNAIWDALHDDGVNHSSYKTVWYVVKMPWWSGPSANTLMHEAADDISRVHGPLR